MLKKLRILLKQPFPIEQPTNQIVLSLAGIGLFVSLFLIIFQPFHTDIYVQTGRTWVLWGYGVVTIVALLFNILILPRLFPGIFREANWNILRGLCFQFWHIISIGAANMLYAHFIVGKEISIASISSFFLTALSIGFFPITVSVLSTYIYLLKKYTTSSRRINERIFSHDGPEKTKGHSDDIVIFSESGKEKIELKLKDLLFIKSIENYVEVNRLHQGLRKTALLRSTLNRIEADLKAYPSLFRCHRTYFINVDNISRVTGNSHGYKLGLKSIDEMIPVARSRSTKLNKILP